MQNQNEKISRHCGHGSRVQGCYKEKNTLLNRLDPGYPAGRPSGMTTRSAFTLIELLVGVLIIGILAAVAVPQYQKAVWKSRNVQLKTLVSSVAKSQQIYRMENGASAKYFAELSIDLPLRSTPGGACGMSAVEDASRAGDNFEIQLFRTAYSVIGWWTSGPYKCAGFAYDVQNQELVCTERMIRFEGDEGSFCNKLENATFVREDSSFRSRLYKLSN